MMETYFSLEMGLFQYKITKTIENGSFGAGESGAVG